MFKDVFLRVLVCTVFTLIGSTSASSQRSNEEVIVVRSEPYGAADIVGSISSLAEVEIEDEIPYYFHVSLNDGKTGFIRKADISHTDTLSIAENENLGVSLIRPSEDVITRLRVRSNPTLNAEIIANLSPTDTATFLSSQSDFFEIELSDGRDGFVSKDWAELVKDTTGYEAGFPGDNSLKNNDEASVLELHFLDVGQGDANLIVCPNGNTIIIDSGTTSGVSPDIIRSYISNEITPLGHTIDYLIITHPDFDHYSLLEDVLYEIPIGKAYFVGPRSDYRDPTIYSWINDTPEESVRLVESDFDSPDAPNESIDCGAAKVWVLAADTPAKQSAKNAKSIVIRIQYGAFDAILTGDATFATEKQILDRFPASWLQAELLKVGHHGSLATSTDKHWAGAIKPEVAIVSAGFDNSYGHPRKKVIDKLTPYTVSVEPHPFRYATYRQGKGGRRYRFSNIDAEVEGIYNTAVNGNIVVVTNGVEYRVLLDQGEDD